MRDPQIWLIALASCLVICQAMPNPDPEPEPEPDVNVNLKIDVNQPDESQGNVNVDVNVNIDEDQNNNNTTSTEIESDSSDESSGCNCGIPNKQNRIVGGETVDIKFKYPWHVGLYADSVWPAYFCGGTIINNLFILSAAHCFWGYDGPEIPIDIYVGVGDHNQFSSDDDVNGITLKAFVEEVHFHPFYDEYTLDYDFSLIELSSPLIFGDTIRPICLPENSLNTYEGETGTIVGWGDTFAWGSYDYSWSYDYYGYDYGNTRPRGKSVIPKSISGNKRGDDHSKLNSGGNGIHHDKLKSANKRRIHHNKSKAGDKINFLNNKSKSGEKRSIFHDKSKSGYKKDIHHDKSKSGDKRGSRGGSISDLGSGDYKESFGDYWDDWNSSGDYLDYSGDYGDYSGDYYYDSELAILQEAQVTIMDPTCDNYEYNDNNITAHMLCASYPGKDTCQGDSGGSISVVENGMYVQVGVTSWGIGCAAEGHPGVYSRVSSVLKWIKQVCSDAEWCPRK